MTNARRLFQRICARPVGRIAGVARAGDVWRAWPLAGDKFSGFWMKGGCASKRTRRRGRIARRAVLIVAGRIDNLARRIRSSIG